MRRDCIVLALLLNAICGVRNGLAQTNPTSPRDVLLESVSRGPTPELSREEVSALAAIVGLEVSTAPLGTSSGGFTYAFDESLGVFTRTSSTFGPAFAERSLTSGRGKFSFGFNNLHASYDSIGGQRIDDGSLVTGRTQMGFFPIAYATSTIHLSSNTFVGFGTVGVTNDLDVGVAIPLVRVSVDLDLGLFTSQGVDLIHFTAPKTTATGVGDMAIFGKYRFYRSGDGGVAMQLEVRLPTGDESDLRGIGVTRTSVSGIWSRGGRISPHANFGYEFWSDGVELSRSLGVSAKNQVRYAFGVEMQAHPRVTGNIDVVGRRLLGGGKPEYRVISVPGGAVESLIAGSRSLDIISLAPGIRANVFRTLLLSGSFLTSLENDGLRAKVVPVIGIEWAF